VRHLKTELIWVKSTISFFTKRKLFITTSYWEYSYFNI
jgi:hypothetical protein